MSFKPGGEPALTSDAVHRHIDIVEEAFQKALHPPFQSNVWIRSQTVVCFSLLVRSVSRVRSGSILEGNLVPGQTNACLYPFCVGGYGAWYDIAFACALTAKDRDLHCVPFLSDAGRTHRVEQHFQPLAQVLQAAERQIRDHDITDRDMSPNPLWAPVIDWSDLEIMLVGAAAGFEFPELVKSGNNILSIQIVCTTDQDGIKAVPLGCVLDPGLVNRDIAIVGERLETTIPTTAEAGRLEAALELFFCDFRSTVKCNTCKSWE